LEGALAFFEEEVSEAGSNAVTFSFKFSNEYGEAEAGIIESQMIASDGRSWVSGLSEEEYVA
jgi:hypothetical protein